MEERIKGRRRGGRKRKLGGRARKEEGIGREIGRKGKGTMMAWTRM